MVLVPTSQSLRRATALALVVALLCPLTASAGIIIRGTQGITFTGADGIYYDNVSGITFTGADGLLAFQVNGITEHHDLRRDHHRRRRQPRRDR